MVYFMYIGSNFLATILFEPYQLVEGPNSVPPNPGSRGTWAKERWYSPPKLIYCKAVGQTTQMCEQSLPFSLIPRFLLPESRAWVRIPYNEDDYRPKKLDEDSDRKSDSRSKNLEIWSFDPNIFLSVRGEFPPTRKGKSPNLSTRDSRSCGFSLREPASWLPLVRLDSLTTLPQAVTRNTPQGDRDTCVYIYIYI